MERIGLYPDTIHKTAQQIVDETRAECTTEFGAVRVNKERCKNCPFTPQSAFNYQLKRIVSEIKQLPDNAVMQCHNTFPSDVLGAVCRGGYDYILKDKIKNPQFIEQQTSSYQVIPFGGK